MSSANPLVSRAARKVCPKESWPVARRKLDQVNRVKQVSELALPPGNRLIRINEQYRICFRWEATYAEEVEITDYH